MIYYDIMIMRILLTLFYCNLELKKLKNVLYFFILVSQSVSQS